MKKCIICALLCAGMIGLIPSITQASPLLDQSFTSGKNVDAYFDWSTEYSQTFKVTINGLLTGISLPGFKIDHNVVDPGNLIFKIYSVSSGLPSTALYQVTYTPDSLSNDFFFNLSTAGIQAIAGSSLAFGITSTKGSGYSAYSVAGAETGIGSPPALGYNDGIGYVKYYSSSPWIQFGISFGTFYPGDFFLKSYIDPTLVPEPESIFDLLLFVTCCIVFRSSFMGFRKSQVGQ